MSQNQHQDLLGQLASIRERQGLEPLPDPTKIQGPLPVYDPVAERLREARTYPEDHLETPEPPTFDDEQEQSPLVTIARSPVSIEYPFGEPDIADLYQHPGKIVPVHDLWVGDNQAMYKGRAVELNEGERKAVVTVLLKALRRSLDEQYQEIAGRPMRQRKPKEVTETPKRRGRAAKSAGAAGDSAKA